MRFERVQQTAALARSHYWLLAAIVGAGLFLRTIHVDQEALWADEALTLVIKHWPAYDLIFRPVDPSAGLYYLLAKALIPDGAGVVAARALSVVFGTASILVTYVIGRLSFPRPSWALLAAAMLAVSPVLVDYSQEARGYSLLVFLVLVSAASLLWWSREGGQGGLVLFSAATVLSLYTHFTAAFWIAPAILIGLETADRTGRRRAYSIALVAMALAAIPEIARTFNHVLNYGVLGFLGVAGPLQFLTVTGDTLLPSLWRGGSFSAAALAAAFLYCGYRLSKRVLDPALAVAICLSLVPFLVWIFSYLVTPIFMPRSILLGIPGLILLLVHADRVGRLPAASLIFIAAALAALAFHGTVRAKEPWHPIAEHLQRHMRPGDGLFICPAWRAPALAHALGGLPHPTLVVSEGRPAIVGQGGSWERRLFGPSIAWRVQGYPAPDSVPRGPRRWWLVSMGCEPEDQIIR